VRPHGPRRPAHRWARGGLLVVQQIAGQSRRGSPHRLDRCLAGERALSTARATDRASSSHPPRSLVGTVRRRARPALGHAPTVPHRQTEARVAPSNGTDRAERCRRPGGSRGRTTILEDVTHLLGRPGPMPDRVGDAARILAAESSVEASRIPHSRVSRPPGRVVFARSLAPAPPDATISRPRELTTGESPRTVVA
jgi:hypothetical protein